MADYTSFGDFKNGPTFSVRRDLFGRKVLKANRPPTLDWKSVGAILNDVVPDHRTNAEQISYLDWYYRGAQPILYREKQIRPEIRNTVVENRAYETVEFKKGYEFGQPKQFVSVSNNNSPINRLNDFARIDGADSKDVELAEWFYKCGTAYKLTVPNRNTGEDEIPYRSVVLDPRNAFIVYTDDVLQDKLIAGTIIKKDVQNKTTYACGVYTDNWYFEWNNLEDLSQFDRTKPNISRPNVLGMIPIVEYKMNQSRIGYIELCISLFDALNVVDSNRLDGLEQFVQALLVFMNCQPPEDENGDESKIESGDIISIMGQPGLPADVKLLASQLDQSQAQVTKEDLLDAIYEITGQPDRKTRGNGGGDTGQAVVLRDGWGAAEARAKITEKEFKRSELESLKVVLKICRELSPQDVQSLTLQDVDIKFTRNRSDNMLTKAQTLQILLSTGVDPKTAFDYCEMFSDPVLAYTLSMATLELKQYQTEAESDNSDPEKTGENADLTNEEENVNDDQEELEE